MKKSTKRVSSLVMATGLFVSGIGLTVDDQTKEEGVRVERTPLVSHAFDQNQTVEERKQELKEKHLKYTKSPVLKKLIEMDILVPDPKEDVMKHINPSLVFNPNLKNKENVTKSVEPMDDIKNEEKEIPIEKVLEHLGIDTESKELPAEISEKIHEYVINSKSDYDYERFVNKRGQHIVDWLQEVSDFIESGINCIINQTPDDNPYEYLLQEKYYPKNYHTVYDQAGNIIYTVYYKDIFDAQKYLIDINNIHIKGKCIIDPKTYQNKRDEGGRGTTLSGIVIYNIYKCNDEALLPKGEKKGVWKVGLVEIGYANEYRDLLEGEYRYLIIDTPVQFYEQSQPIEGLEPKTEEQSFQTNEPVKYEHEAKVLYELGLFNGISETKFIPDLENSTNR